MAKYTKRLNLKCWHYFSWLEITYDMPGFSNLLEVNTCRKELSFFSYIVFFQKILKTSHSAYYTVSNNLHLSSKFGPEMHHNEYQIKFTKRAGHSSHTRESLLQYTQVYHDSKLHRSVRPAFLRLLWQTLLPIFTSFKNLIAKFIPKLCSVSASRILDTIHNKKCLDTRKG